jgi:hypothetical protein
MATPYDPYKTPTAVDTAPVASAPTSVPYAVVELLVQTRPWVKLMAVLVFVSFGLALLVAVGVSLASDPGTRSRFWPLIGTLAFLVPAAVFLWKFADSIRQLQGGGGQAALESALRNQKSFWKYLGIVACGNIALFFLGLVLGFLVGRRGG